jgi:glycerol-3-phosphate acyltransferase PlsX
MGGDEGPRPAIEGAVLAAQEHNLEVVLVGKPRHLERLLKAHKVNDSRISIVEATDVISMEDSPRKTLARKESSLAVATRLVKEGKADALVSAGNTGAVLAHTLFSWRTIGGIRKPAIATFLPTHEDRVIVIDAGANVDCKAHQLVQFGVMGSAYARHVLKRERPRVALLSNGEEPTKGNEATIEAHQILKTTDLNFLGNAEGGDVFRGEIDVITCDGFTGNVLLKSSEGLASTLFGLIKREVRKSVVMSAAAVLMTPAFKAIKRRTDYDEYGGAPLLGVDGVAIVAHGRSNKKAYMNAIRVAAECHQLQLVKRLDEALQRNEQQIRAAQPDQPSQPGPPDQPA